MSRTRKGIPGERLTVPPGGRASEVILAVLRSIESQPVQLILWRVNCYASTPRPSNEEATRVDDLDGARDRPGGEQPPGVDTGAVVGDRRTSRYQ